MREERIPSKSAVTTSPCAPAVRTPTSVLAYANAAGISLTTPQLVPPIGGMILLHPSSTCIGVGGSSEIRLTQVESDCVPCLGTLSLSIFDITSYRQRARIFVPADSICLLWILSPWVTFRIATSVFGWIQKRPLLSSGEGNERVCVAAQPDAPARRLMQFFSSPSFWLLRRLVCSGRPFRDICFSPILPACGSG
jgi:hypothetical protein